MEVERENIADAQELALEEAKKLNAVELQDAEDKVKKWRDKLAKQASLAKKRGDKPLIKIPLDMRQRMHFFKGALNKRLNKLKETIHSGAGDFEKVAEERGPLACFQELESTALTITNLTLLFMAKVRAHQVFDGDPLPKCEMVRYKANQAICFKISNPRAFFNTSRDRMLQISACPMHYKEYLDDGLLDDVHLQFRKERYFIN